MAEFSVLKRASRAAATLSSSAWNTAATVARRAKTRHMLSLTMTPDRQVSASPQGKSKDLRRCCEEAAPRVSGPEYHSSVRSQTISHKLQKNQRYRITIRGFPGIPNLGAQKSTPLVSRASEPPPKAGISFNFIFDSTSNVSCRRSHARSLPDVTRMARPRSQDRIMLRKARCCFSR